MEITYHWEGDYLIPDLKLSDTTEYQIGKYGRMRKRFLEENHRGIYSYMILSETLWKHLAEIDEECNEMMDRLVRQMAKKEGVTEQLKSDDWLCWLQKMNSIRHLTMKSCAKWQNFLRKKNTYANAGISTRFLTVSPAAMISLP
ncbi:hypothetical protein C804_02982 [Lachnospiraceae bacterium A4]|nr:hypothetical protein C804_02982 [Lachnospiraceae bacterium A4]